MYELTLEPDGHAWPGPSLLPSWRPSPSPTRLPGHSNRARPRRQPRLLRTLTYFDSGLGGGRSGRFLVAMLDRRELQSVLALDVDLHRVAPGDLSTQQVLGQLVFDPARDDAPKRARAIDPVVALLGEKVFGRVRDLDRYLLLDQVLAQLVQLQVDDLPDLRRGQALEHDHRVNSIEELRAEHPLQLLIDLFLRVLVAT